MLETRNQPLGVVTAIIGQTYLNVEFLGEAGHAGTVPMLLRRDALAGAAEAMLLGETLARETKGEVVATVGRIAVAPGATNVIPANVVVDLRHPLRLGDRAREARRDAEVPACARSPTGAISASPSRRRARSRPRRAIRAIQDQFAEAIRALGAEPLRLGSGAGHDGQAMAKLCPDRHAVRALPRRHQPQPDGICEPARPRPRGRGADRVHRAVRSGEAWLRACTREARHCDGWPRSHGYALQAGRATAYEQ